jgi:rod shape-determining protein MreC
VRAVLVNAGSQQGVAKGQAVTDGRYVIGQVITAGRLSARILLITDLNSRVPVMIERSGDRAILAGDNSPLPSLKFLPVGAELHEGDRILTSGDGGVFPARLPVGEAVMTADGLRIRPLVDFARLEYALILDYHFPELREPVEEAPGLEVAAP